VRTVAIVNGYHLSGRPIQATPNPIGKREQLKDGPQEVGTLFIVVVELRRASRRHGRELTPSRMLLSVRPGTALAERQDFIARWYREEIRAALPALLTVWMPRLGVRVNGVFIQQMKTKWGSCNPRAGTIRLNTEIAKKPNECLEYVLVHEMLHLIEPTHNAHFIALIDQFMPRWQLLRQRLNRLPVRHEDWIY